jgi:hypothetical protein
MDRNDLTNVPSLESQPLNNNREDSPVEFVCERDRKEIGLEKSYLELRNQNADNLRAPGSGHKSII